MYELHHQKVPVLGVLTEHGSRYLLSCVVSNTSADDHVIQRQQMPLQHRRISRVS
jgi:hypothetical protein